MDELAQDKDTSQEIAARASPKDVAPPLLKAAIRRARVEEAERSDVLAELRGAELARLEMLQDALAPVLAEIPPEADIFDVGLMPTAHPRLFIDMIGFIEMGRDRRLYRFVQDTKHGRVTLAESEKIETMVKAVADYIAHRLVEREKALAADAPIGERLSAKLPENAGAVTPVIGAKHPQKSFHRFNQIFSFTVELLGSMVLFALIAAGCYYLLTLIMNGSGHPLNH